MVKILIFEFKVNLNHNFLYFFFGKKLFFLFFWRIVYFWAKKVTISLFPPHFLNPICTLFLYHTFRRLSIYFFSLLHFPQIGEQPYRGAFLAKRLFLFDFPTKLRKCKLNLATLHEDLAVNCFIDLFCYFLVSNFSTLFLDTANKSKAPFNDQHGKCSYYSQ